MSGEVDAISVLHDQIDALDDQLDEAADLLVGLVQLIQRREPDLVRNHRYLDAVAWLEQYDGDRA